MNETQVLGLVILLLGLGGGLVQVRRCSSCGRLYWPRTWGHRHWHDGP